VCKGHRNLGPHANPEATPSRVHIHGHVEGGHTGTGSGVPQFVHKGACNSNTTCNPGSPNHHCHPLAQGNMLTGVKWE